MEGLIEQEPLQVGEKLRTQINESLQSIQQTTLLIDLDEFLSHERLVDIRWRLDAKLETIETFNFSKIEEILSQCHELIKTS